MSNVFSRFQNQYDPDYGFEDLNIGSNNRDLLANTEGFTFGSFNTMTQDWWLTQRDAPTPSEKEITYDLPYKQGVDDFSGLEGVRFFDMREISYTLICVDEDYSYRKEKTLYLKRALMEVVGYRELDDTAHPGFCWNAKCESVSIDDNEADSVVTATVKFKAYPYAIARHDDGSDVWDDVEFDRWVWQDVTFSGNEPVVVENMGSKPAEVKFKVTGPYGVTGPGITKQLNITPSNQDSVTFAMPVGSHTYWINGSGQITFIFKREEML